MQHHQWFTLPVYFIVDLGSVNINIMTGRRVIAVWNVLREAFIE
jgi:hypothetical protein